jgi:hypothetical protein
MEKPGFLSPTDNPTTITRIFGAPVVAKGLTGLPLLEIITWGMLTYIAGCKNPGWSPSKRRLAGAITMLILFGSEWCHNLAHAAMAHRVGKPADAILILWGTPLLVYYASSDEGVTPRQHILRSSGGPLFNLSMLPFAWLARRMTRKGSLAHYAANFALGTNTFISTVALLPIPGIDGGPLMKWSLVEAGKTPTQADETVKRINLAMGSGMAVASAVSFKKKRRWIGAAIAAFAATSLAIGLGLLKESKG